jgi:tetratricopeptide (TPR) repeat protein
LGQELAVARRDTGASDLDDRILQLVLPQLRRYLTSHNSGYTTICHQGYAEFWSEKADDFAKLAEQILNERRDSGRRVFRVAQYLRDGLGRTPRAIEVLLIARGQGRLDENMDYTLVQWLRDANRLPEAIGILESLTKLRPDNMLYRTDMMSAYFAAQRLEQLQQLIEQVDTHFHTKGLWTEGNAAQFAAGCLAVNEPARAKKYMSEAIVLHQRANPENGVNDQTLSSFYQQLASMETTLGNTREAVTAAMSSISCWGSRHEYRAQTLESLKSTLRSAKDLDGLVKQLDAEAEQSGQENPILRKAIGQIWQERGEHAKAIVQLNLALELQPNDRETHQSLIACFDASDNPVAASVQLRKLIDLMPNDLTLYSQLADRQKDNPTQSERAATSIVESSPNEAEPHQLYAERLQSLNRWSEAIPHWQQVARYRKLEPTGLLKLAEAQLHQKQFDGAKVTLKTLRSTMWPSRFTDVDNQIRNLENQLPQTVRPNL